ncbi:MAG TPA: sulfatase [Gemmatimonadales bacterium]|nr:sulfatase [Gemmatimonadales bacterium]
MSDLLATAVWFAVAAGLVEAGITLARQFVLREFVWTPWLVVWAAPAAYLALSAGPAALVACLGGAFPACRRLDWMVLVGAATGCWGLLLFLLGRWLHPAALALLALGIALQVARAVRRRPPALLLLVRRTTLPLVLVLALAAAATAAVRALRERILLATLPPARPGAPNVLLIILDTVRADRLSLYGHERPTTPALERWADRGVVFEQAWSTAPWTLPSHASIFTGRYPHELAADWLEPLEAGVPTLAEIFRAHGYATAGFAGNLLYTGYESGLARGFAHYEDFPLTFTQFRLSSELGQQYERWSTGWRRAKRATAERRAADVTGPFLRWVDRAPRPFFVFLNYFDAHKPYRPSPETLRRFDAGSPQEDKYDALLAELDRELDRLLRELEHRGLLRHTLVVLTSDHGELFGEHGLSGHGNALYAPLLHVPLVIWYEGRVPAGVRVAGGVSLRDLGRTILDLAGVEAGRFPGRSLAPTWGGDRSPAVAPTSPRFAAVSRGIRTEPHEPVTRGDMRSLAAGRLHYILNGDGTEELYDLVTDPAEARNLAETRDAIPVLACLRRRLVDLGALPKRGIPAGRGGPAGAAAGSVFPPGQGEPTEVCDRAGPGGAS